MSAVVVGRIYNPKCARVGDPTPFDRQAEVIGLAADRWFDFFERVSRHAQTSAGAMSGLDPYKIFDADVVMLDAARTLGGLAELEHAYGERAVRDWITRAIDKVREAS